MKKIAAITFHSSYNFGSNLQAFALQKAVEKCDKNNIEYPKFELKINDMTKKELSIYLNKSVITIENGLRDYEKATGENIRKYEDGELKISESAIEWLIKNKYKNKYLQLLEDYKMLLTEIYKKNGGYYDNFLGRN